MRKSIAIFGGSLFQDIKYENGSFIPTPNQAAIKLSKEYKIDNYSYEGLDMNRVSRLIQSLPISGYSDCILALGEGDLNDPLAFQTELCKVIDYLKEQSVRPLLVSLPQNLMKMKKGIRIQEILDQIAVEKNVDYIYEGKTDKQVSYMVLEQEDMTSAILNLC